MTLELTDTWPMVKHNACALFDVNPNDYLLQYQGNIDETKKVRNKGVPTRVGEFPFSGGELILRKAKPSATPSSSANDAQNVDSSSPPSSDS